jgi:hypothetical protein
MIAVRHGVVEAVWELPALPEKTHRMPCLTNWWVVVRCQRYD